jgi:protein O-GlcNAc transferase
VLHDLGRQEDSIDWFKKALKINPDFLRAKLNLCVAQIPAIYLEEEDIRLSRKRYRDELENLKQFILSNNNIGLKEFAKAELQPFFLAYQGCNDRDLQCSYSELASHIQRNRYPQFRCKPSIPPIKPGDQIRVGFVSSHFYNSVDWNFIIKGWVENLNKERFQIFGYYTGVRKDEQTELARKNFSKFVQDIYSIEELGRIVRHDRLHVLIYPHIGRNPLTSKLAAHRLAPVQSVGWGHPSTTGLPSMDYFLSKDLSEPAGAEFYYSERLVRLPNLSIYLGLPQDGVLFYCGQSLCKYLPQYDDIFPRIAQKLGKCHFIFKKDSRSPVITNIFRKRLSQAFARYDLSSESYVTMFPKLDEVQYYGLFRLADVFLDSIGYSGFTTTLDAIAFDLPIVTFQAALMRGRQSLGILTMMGIKETIAATVDDYVSHAVKLGANASWRRKMSRKIAENKKNLYRDRTCIEGLEAFLEEAVSQHRCRAD